MDVKRFAALGLFAAVFVCMAQPSVAAVRRVLLSVDGLTVPKDKAIFAYRIDTFGIEFLAVCSVPSGWELRSQKYENSEGYLAGQAGLHARRLRLTAMYLIDVYEYRAETRREGSAEHPASFSGWVQIGSREQFGDWRGRKVTLGPNNFRLTNATRCPAPPLAQP